MAAEVCKMGDFFVKLPIFYQKMLSCRTSAAIKLEKVDIQNLIHKFVACTLGYISNNLWTNWTIFQELVRFSVEFFFQIFAPSAEKKVFFWPKIGKFLAKFSKFWKSIVTI